MTNYNKLHNICLSGGWVNGAMQTGEQTAQELVSWILKEVFIYSLLRKIYSVILFWYWYLAKILLTIISPELI